MNVAVTGVGGGVGQSIIKTLQNTEYSSVGIDGEVLGTGLYATKKSYVGLYANQPKYIETLIQICKKEDCDAIFPGLDVELTPFSNNVDNFKANNITPIVSSPSVISICTDKLYTVDFLRKNNFPYPKTYRLADYSFQLGFPVQLKPQKGGHRSIGGLVATNQREFAEFTRNVDVNNYVVQEYIEGEEYTCGSVSFENGCVGVILMKRELRNGDTYKAFVVKNETLSTFVKTVINALKPFGACNVQLRVKEGVPYIFEFNARCSGTTASRALAGFNEPKMICDYLFKGIKEPEFRINEIVILRYWKEIAVSYDKIKQLASNGFLFSEGIDL